MILKKFTFWGLVVILSILGSVNTLSAQCPNTKVGTINGMTGFVGQSTRHDLSDTIFLCWGDRFDIDHNDDYLLGDDSNTQTPPGIGYAWYKEKPTRTGPFLSDIKKDQEYRILPSEPLNIMVTLDELDGDAEFSNYYYPNHTTFSEYYNYVNNLGNPAIVHYAPITAEWKKGKRGYYENGNASCVEVNTSESFPVVYLNPIKIYDIQYNVDGDPLKASFRVTGGLPEFYKKNQNKTAYYTSIDVVDYLYGGPDGDVLTQSVSNGDLVVVKVPDFNPFNVTVSDGVSCFSVNQLDVSEGTSPRFMMDTISGARNSIKQITFSTRDYHNIEEALGFIVYNPDVLQFVSLDAKYPFPYTVNHLADKRIYIDWNSIPSVSFQNKKELFTLSYKLTGKVGDCSPVVGYKFQVTEDSILVTQDSVINIYFDHYPHVDPGLVCIDPPTNDLYVSTSFCNSGSDGNGSISFKIFNGKPDYNYVIEKGGTVVSSGVVSEERVETSIFGLNSGSYVVKVTDADAVVYTTHNINLSTDPQLEFEDIYFKQPKCFGECNGLIGVKVKPFGGLPAQYKIRWSTNEFGVDSIKGLCNGTYGVTIVDKNNGCETDSYVTLNTPKIEVDLQVIDSASCEGVNDAKVRAIVTGGTPAPGYKFTWINTSTNNQFYEEGVDTSVFANVESGVINFKVRDKYPYCGEDLSITIPTKYKMEVESSKEDVSCYDAGDGKAKFKAKLIGNNNSSFDLDLYKITFPPVPVVNTISVDSFVVTDLGQGELVVKITETNLGCEVFDTVQIDSPPDIGVQLAKTSTVCCPQTQLAYAKFNFYSGDAPFTLSGVGADVQISQIPSDYTFYDLEVGNHSLVITDKNGCEKTYDFTINKGEGCLNIDTIKFESLGCDVTATTDIIVEASSQKGQIVYSWTNENGDALGDGTNILKDVGEGTYIVGVDDGSCSYSDTITIPKAEPFSLSNDIDDAECAVGELGGELGAARINIVGGNTGYTFAWSNGMSGDDVTGLAAGEYMVTVSDGNGCSQIDTVVIGGASPILIDYLDLQDVSCNDGQTADGSVTIKASGGDNPVNFYNFKFNGISSGQPGVLVTYKNLGAGDNYLSVSYNTIKGNTCTLLDTVTIGQPDRIELDKINSTVINPSCYGDCDGKVIVVAKGGNDEKYFYKWQEIGEQGSVGYNLCAGTYHIQITDANLCSIVDSFVLIQPDPLVVEIDSAYTKDVNCSGDNSGEIKIKYTGGNVGGGYTFDWNPDVSDTKLASNLSKGVYVVTVTDSKGCSDFASYEVKGQAPIVFNAVQADTIKCFGDKTCIYLDTVYGGAGPDYGFSINGGAVISADSCQEVYASKEAYLISVFDAEGCREDKELLISQPEEIIVDLGDEITIDLGDTKTVHLNTNANISKVTWEIDTINLNYNFLNDIHSELDLEAFANSIIYATVEDVDGCSASGELNVKVNTFRNVRVPNIFTPDGDGINEEFSLTIGKGVEKVNYIKIYNRWGELIFLEENLLPFGGTVGSWDGTRNGRKLNSGVYVYMVEVKFLDKRTILYRGSITLVR